MERKEGRRNRWTKQQREGDIKRKRGKIKHHTAGFGSVFCQRLQSFSLSDPIGFLLQSTLSLQSMKAGVDAM